MTIESTKLETAVVLKVAGRMDAENASKFQRACDEWTAKGITHLIVDLSELQYVSSMGLASFLAVAKGLQAKSGSMILCQLPGSAQAGLRDKPVNRAVSGV